jgi:hypothetical protein
VVVAGDAEEQGEGKKSEQGPWAMHGASVMVRRGPGVKGLR